MNLVGRSYGIIKQRMVNMETNKKNIIITGAASGVGKELTKQMIKKGAYVAALDINEDNLNTLKQEINL